MEGGRSAREPGTISSLDSFGGAALPLGDGRLEGRRWVSRLAMNETRGAQKLPVLVIIEYDGDMNHFEAGDKSHALRGRKTK